MASYLDFEGIYDKNKRYMVHNWSPEDFVHHFGEDSTYNDTNVIVNSPAYDLRINAGEMRELGQFEAYTITKHFVNREMLREAIGKEGRERERIEMAMNNKDMRKVYEDKTIKEIKSGEETPFMDGLREKIRAEEIAKLKAVKLEPEVEPMVEKTVEKPKKAGRPPKNNNAEFQGL